MTFTKTSLVASLLALAFAGAAQAQETKVAIGISGWTGFAPLTLPRKPASSRNTAWT